MKHTLIIATFLLLTSCAKEQSSSQQISTPTSKPVASEQPIPAQSIASESELLIQNSDCLTCHALKTKLVGPSFFEIAEKYGKDSKEKETLVAHIIKGSSGVWGQIQMQAHPNLDEQSAKKMLDYILSLSNN